MKKTPTDQQVNDFFELEEQHWQLVKQASLNGDKDATLALEQLRVLSVEIDALSADHEKLHYTEDPATLEARTVTCNLIMELIASLIIQRRAILYEDYGILKRKMQIYVDTLERQMSGHSIHDININ
jgi:hypothetical protein